MDGQREREGLAGFGGLEWRERMDGRREREWMRASCEEREWLRGERENGWKALSLRSIILSPGKLSLSRRENEWGTWFM